MAINQTVRIATVSDIHLGHPNNKTNKIIKNLERYLVNNKFLSTIDILFIAGDLFDSELTFGDIEAIEIDLFINRLIYLCGKNNVILRVLEGTPSHDRNQSKRFDLHSKLLKINIEADVKYVKDLSIEYIEKFNMNVLYVPDEWGTAHAVDTLDQVKALLVKNNLKTVDIAIMHGIFPHQVNYDNITIHDSEEYCSLVNIIIFIGHIHTFSHHLKIVAQGSVDRLRHGEEEDKGFVRAEIHPDNTYNLTFIKNTTAMIFKTIHCTSDDITENLLYIDKQLINIPDDSYIRIKANKDNPILSNMSVLKQRWMQYNWSHVIDNKDKKQTKKLIDHKEIYVPVSLDRTSLPVLLMNDVNKATNEKEIQETCKLLLNEVLMEL